MVILLQIPDKEAKRVLDMVAVATGYDAASGATKEQHLRRCLLSWVRSVVQETEIRKASEKAAASVPGLDLGGEA